MRRLSSILLFAAMLLPQVSAMLLSGAPSDAGLPACCRRNGKHHCAMSAEQRAKMTQITSEKRFGAPLEKCPMQQKALAAVHHEQSVVGAAGVTTAALLQEPSAAAQAECLRRISFDRSRQKRGPPATQLS
jgi:hypothetical protein